MANAKYELSMDSGTIWAPIGKQEARSRLSKCVHEPTLEFREIDKGKISNMMGWGLLRRKSGRWNSKAELDAKTLKYFIKYMIQKTVLKNIHDALPMAMREKDRVAVLKEVQKLAKAEIAKMKVNPKFEKYLEKIQEYSP